MNYAHISARVVALPPKGVDEQTETAISRGQIRKVVDTGRFDDKGRMLRAGVTKGVTFEYPDRAAHRAKALAERRAR